MALKTRQYFARILFTALGLIIVLVYSSNVTGSEFMFWFRGYTYLGKENIVLQESRSDCGPAALMNIFFIFNINSSLDEIKLSAGTNSVGTSMYGLAKAARSKGLSTKGYLLNWRELESVEMPVIALVQKDHFVVVNKILANSNVIIIDPSVGRIELGKQDFLQVWKGEILSFEKP